MHRPSLSERERERESERVSSGQSKQQIVPRSLTKGCDEIGSIADPLPHNDRMH